MNLLNHALIFILIGLTFGPPGAQAQEGAPVPIEELRRANSQASQATSSAACRRIRVQYRRVYDRVHRRLNRHLPRLRRAVRALDRTQITLDARTSWISLTTPGDLSAEYIEQVRALRQSLEDQIQSRIGRVVCPRNYVVSNGEWCIHRDYSGVPDSLAEIEQFNREHDFTATRTPTLTIFGRVTNHASGRSASACAIILTTDEVTAGGHYNDQLLCVGYRINAAGEPALAIEAGYYGQDPIARFTERNSDLAMFLSTRAEALEDTDAQACFSPSANEE